MDEKDGGGEKNGKEWNSLCKTMQKKKIKFQNRSLEDWLQSNTFIYTEHSNILGTGNRGAEMIQSEVVSRWLVEVGTPRESKRLSHVSDM